MNNFAVRAGTPLPSKWLQEYGEISKHPAFKTIKADIEKGGGKIGPKTVYSRKWCLMKSVYVSPNPLERSGWKSVSFQAMNNSNVSVFEKNGVMVKTERDDNGVFIFVGA